MASIKILDLPGASTAGELSDTQLEKASGGLTLSMSSLLGPKPVNLSLQRPSLPMPGAIGIGIGGVAFVRG